LSAARSIRVVTVRDALLAPVRSTVRVAALIVLSRRVSGSTARTRRSSKISMLVSAETEK